MTQDEVLKRAQFCSELRGLSKNTQEEYYTKTKRFQQFHGRSATELSIVDIQNYLHYLSKEKGLSVGSVNTYKWIALSVSGGAGYSAESQSDTLSAQMSEISRHYRPFGKLPLLRSLGKVVTMLSVCDNLRDRTMLATMYGAGLRISEVACLRVGRTLTKMSGNRGADLIESVSGK